MVRNFNYYRDCFTGLNTNKTGVYQAPHKPLLLLAIMDLVESGAITSQRIYLTDGLIAAFKQNAGRYIGHSVVFKPDITKPFYHLDHEPFWRLVQRAEASDCSIAAEPTVRYGKKAKPSYSVSGLRRDYEYAEIDEELLRLIQNQDGRAKLRTILISTYLMHQPNRISPLAATIPAICSLLSVIA